MEGVEIDMDDLIRRSDAIEAIKDNSFALGDDYLEINGYGAIDDIRALPSVERPRGEWRNIDGEPVPLDEGGRPTESAWCSECDNWLVASDELFVIGRFCPNCGADMRKENDR